MTKLSSPILRSAKSVTAKLKISCTPYIELNIDDEPLSDGFVNCSGNFIDTYFDFRTERKKKNGQYSWQFSIKFMHSNKYLSYPSNT